MRYVGCLRPEAVLEHVTRLGFGMSCSAKNHCCLHCFVNSHHIKYIIVHFIQLFLQVLMSYELFNCWLVVIKTNLSPGWVKILKHCYDFLFAGAVFMFLLKLLCNQFVCRENAVKTVIM